MALTKEQHIAWEQILSLADNARMREGVADGDVPADCGLHMLVAMYRTAEGWPHLQANAAVLRLNSPTQYFLATSAALVSGQGAAAVQARA